MLKSRGWAGIFVVVALLIQPSCKKQRPRQPRPGAVDEASVAKINKAVEGAASGDDVQLKPVKRPLIAKPATDTAAKKADTAIGDKVQAKPGDKPLAAKPATGDTAKNTDTATGDKVQAKPGHKPIAAKPVSGDTGAKPVLVKATNGGKFSGVERIQVATLTESPKKYVGKEIALVGDVATISASTKKWFSMTDDKSGARVRVFAAPRFLTPSNAAGLAVHVEGKVEILKTPAKEALILNKDHKIPLPKEVKGEIYQEVILRASAARFR